MLWLVFQFYDSVIYVVLPTCGFIMSLQFLCMRGSNLTQRPKYNVEVSSVLWNTAAVKTLPTTVGSLNCLCSTALLMVDGTTACSFSLQLMNNICKFCMYTYVYSVYTIFCILVCTVSVITHSYIFINLNVLGNQKILITLMIKKMSFLSTLRQIWPHEK